MTNALENLRKFEESMELIRKYAPPEEPAPEPQYDWKAADLKRFYK